MGSFCLINCLGVCLIRLYTYLSVIKVKSKRSEKCRGCRDGYRVVSLSTALHDLLKYSHRCHKTINLLAETARYRNLHMVIQKNEAYFRGTHECYKVPLKECCIKTQPSDTQHVPMFVGMHACMYVYMMHVCMQPDMHGFLHGMCVV